MKKLYCKKCKKEDIKHYYDGDYLYCDKDCKIDFELENKINKK